MPRTRKRATTSPTRLPHATHSAPPLITSPPKIRRTTRGDSAAATERQEQIDSTSSLNDARVHASSLVDDDDDMADSARSISLLHPLDVAMLDAAAAACEAASIELSEQELLDSTPSRTFNYTPIEPEWTDMAQAQIEADGAAEESRLLSPCSIAGSERSSSSVSSSSRSPGLASHSRASPMSVSSSALTVILPVDVSTLRPSVSAALLQARRSAAAARASSKAAGPFTTWQETVLARELEKDEARAEQEAHDQLISPLLEKVVRAMRAMKVLRHSHIEFPSSLSDGRRAKTIFPDPQQVEYSVLVRLEKGARYSGAAGWMLVETDVRITGGAGLVRTSLFRESNDDAMSLEQIHPSILGYSRGYVAHSNVVGLRKHVEELMQHL